MTQCHLCALQYLDPNNKQSSFLARCCNKKKCNKKYCLQCIRQKYDPGFQVYMYKPDTWICFSCQSICLCAPCKNSNNMEKKPNKKKALQNSNIKPQTKIQILKQQVLQDYYKQEYINSGTPFMKKILQNRNNVYRLMANAGIGDKSAKNIKTNLEQRITEPVKQEQRKDEKNIKQLIKKTLNEYNQDQIDIQLID